MLPLFIRTLLDLDTLTALDPHELLSDQLVLWTTPEVHIDVLTVSWEAALVFLAGAAELEFVRLDTGALEVVLCVGEVPLWKVLPGTLAAFTSLIHQQINVLVT